MSKEKDEYSVEVAKDTTKGGLPGGNVGKINYYRIALPSIDAVLATTGVTGMAEIFKRLHMGKDQCKTAGTKVVQVGQDVLLLTIKSDLVRVVF